MDPTGSNIFSVDRVEKKIQEYEADVQTNKTKRIALAIFAAFGALALTAGCITAIILNPAFLLIPSISLIALSIIGQLFPETPIDIIGNSYNIIQGPSKNEIQKEVNDIHGPITDDMLEHLKKYGKYKTFFNFNYGSIEYPLKDNCDRILDALPNQKMKQIAEEWLNKKDLETHINGNMLNTHIRILKNMSNMTKEELEKRLAILSKECDYTSSDKIVQVLEYCPNLERISLNDVNQKILYKLGQLQKIKNLTFYAQKNGNLDFRVLPTSLKSMHLLGDSFKKEELTQNNIEWIGKLKNLESLNLFHGFIINEALIQQVLKMPKLKEFNLENAVDYEKRSARF